MFHCRLAIMLLLMVMSFHQACGGLADMGGAVAALQQQQQALLLVAQETTKLREETEQRTQAASAK